MTTDTSERGLERLICTALTGHPCDPVQPGALRERPPTYAAGWIGGHSQDYDRDHCLDLAQLAAFLKITQPDTADLLNLDEDSPTRRKFLARLQGEITKRGTIDLLRKGLNHGPHRIDLFYGTPSPEQSEGQRTVRPQPLQRNPPAPLQPRPGPARPRPLPLHQRPARRHLRAEEQPDQADGR